MAASARKFFKQQDERMNLLDDDTGRLYLARMTAQSQKPSDKTKVDVELNDMFNDIPRSPKRRIDQPSPLPSSPRIKRPKTATPSTSVDAQGAPRHNNQHSPAFPPIGDPILPCGSRLDTLHGNNPTSESVGARHQGEIMITFDDEPLPATRSKDKGLARPGNSFDVSTAPPSPIEDASTFTTVIPTQKKERSPLEIQVEAKHLHGQKARKAKPIPLTKLQKPKPQSICADGTSLIQNYSSSSPSSPEARNTSPSPLVSQPKSGPSKASKITSKKVIAAAKKSSTTAKGKGKGKAPPAPKPSPYDYAVQVQARADEAKANGTAKTGNYVQFLEGYRVFYAGLDITRKAGDGTQRRIDIILKYGGRIEAKYSSDVTHIVTEKDLHESILVRACGLKNLSEIPSRIPIVTWAWIVKLIDINPFPKSGKVTDIRHVELFEYGTYARRLPPTSLSVNAQARKHTLKKDEDFSCISEFSATNISPDRADGSSSPKPDRHHGRAAKTVSSRAPLNFQPQLPVKTQFDDPLVKFYRRVQESHQRDPRPFNEFDSDIENSDSESDDDAAVSRPKRDWLCKQPKQQVLTGPCPNQDIIAKIEELQELHRSKPSQDDKWRVFSYNKAIRALRSHPKRIRCYEDALKLRGIGHKTALKVMEIIETGDLRRIAYERTEDVLVTSIFTKIYNVGQQTAMKWYLNGCRTLDDLRAGKGGVNLTEGQKIGLEFYEDLNTRMPREEAKAIFELIKPIALRIDPKLFVDIMGSYRRGKSDCGDIDILITRCPDDGRTHEGVLHQLIKKLHTGGILTEDLALPDHTKPLEAVYHGICRLPNVAGARRRRIDFLTVPWSSKGGALLYYTGDDMFNRSMRLLANKMGFSLNQRGLYEGVVRDPRNRTVKLHDGTLVASKTEEEIFKKLGVPWREPHERVTHYEDIMKAEEEQRRKVAKI